MTAIKAIKPLRSRRVEQFFQLGSYQERFNSNNDPQFYTNLKHQRNTNAARVNFVSGKCVSQ